MKLVRTFYRMKGDEIPFEQKLFSAFFSWKARVDGKTTYYPYQNKLVLYFHYWNIDLDALASNCNLSYRIPPINFYTGSRLIPWTPLNQNISNEKKNYIARKHSSQLAIQLCYSENCQKQEWYRGKDKNNSRMNTIF